MTADLQLDRDLAMLRVAEAGGPPHFRLWSVDRHTVVVGRSVEVEREVDVAYCRRHAIPIVRRPSGGRSVVIGPGTLQYAFALRYDLASELHSIPASKRWCNRMLVGSLPESLAIGEDASGDLVVATRKVGGLSLKRRRDAMLLHGSLLLAADISVIADALKCPEREPEYRCGRNHEEFLANLGAIDAVRLETTVRRRLAELAQG